MMDGTNTLATVMLWVYYQFVTLLVWFGLGWLVWLGVTLAGGDIDYAWSLVIIGVAWMAMHNYNAIGESS